MLLIAGLVASVAMSWTGLVVFLAVLTVAFAQVDKTREDRAMGSAVVQAVVDLIREHCIYPDDRLFLRRLAYVESRDGMDPKTFRPGYFGGIWQVPFG